MSFCKYLRTLYPPDVRIGIVLDNFSPHLSTTKDHQVGQWAEANNVELAYVRTDASWLHRIECHFAALRYFALDGTDPQGPLRTRRHDPSLHRLARAPRQR